MDPNPWYLHMIQSLGKRDFILEKQNTENILPFSVTQIINAFLSSMISANNDKGEGF